jgi:ubiquinone/menaquinone biosynthesis C-methylase UbiE
LDKHSHDHKNYQWTDDHAEQFVQRMGKQLKSRYKPFAKEISEIYVKYQNSDNPRIMDLACGPAYLLMEIQKRIPTASFLGVDTSEKMLKYARQKLEEYGFQGVEFKQGAAESLPLEDNSYSIITCFNSLHDFKDPKKALSEVYRVLEKNGIFIVKDKNPSYPKWKMKIYFYFLRFQLGKERAKHYYQSSHHWISPEQMENWMKELNFQVKFISKGVDFVVVGQK